MPAFDPVRDAVQNSPISPSQPLLTANPRIETISSAPYQNRRATDLSVLLNSNSREPSVSPPPRTSTLSHLLHSDTEHNVLDRSSHSSSPEHSSQPSSSFSGAHLPSSHSSSNNSSLTPMFPPTISKIPYNPIRITPADTVLIPMSPDEMERYKNYRGTATQILSKRKREPSRDEFGEQPIKKLHGDVGVVVGHYNSRPNVDVTQRLESPIIGLKKFNNWVKSVLITRFAHPALAAGTRNVRRRSGKVLDMGCGKGGDLPKWAKARVKELIGVDIAAVSVEQARSRWECLRAPRFEATFAALDCYSEPLSKAFSPEKLEQPFDVVSMQFCMHYAFETSQKARCMLRNVTQWLRPGGTFIGTIPNAEQLLERLDGLPPDVSDLKIGNAIYSIRFEDREKRPLFGHRYWFFLKDAVENVPEYIVRWDNFVQMAQEFQLFPIYKEGFRNFYNEHRQQPAYRHLMEYMNVVNADGEFLMDEEQLEAANIYEAFAFEKR